MLRGPGVNGESYGSGKDGRVVVDMSTGGGSLTKDLEGTDVVIGYAPSSRGWSPNGYRICATRSIRVIGELNVSVTGLTGQNASSGSAAGNGGGAHNSLGKGGTGGEGGVGTVGNAGGTVEGYGGAGGNSGIVSGGQCIWQEYYGSVTSRQMLNLFGWTLGFSDTDEPVTNSLRVINGGGGGAGGSGTGSGRGGGGGGGGGVIWISAPTLIVDPGKVLRLIATGGAGGAGYSIGGDSGSGGGGGGGGLIIMNIGQIILGAGASIEAIVAPGAGAAGSGGGATGSPGSVGHVLVFTPETVYDNVNGGAGVTVVTAQ